MNKKLEYAVGDINSVEKGTGARANKGKVAFSLLPLHLLAGTARVFMGGKLKYAPYNWAKGLDFASTFDCLLRHLIKWFFLGEDKDDETGEHHLDHAMANLLMLRHYVETFKEGDNRPSSKLTYFSEELNDFNTLFNEDDFLSRNPAIKAHQEEENSG